MKTRDIVLSVLAIIAVFFIILQSDEEERRKKKPEVTVYVSEKRACAAPVLSDFEKRSGVRVHAVYFDSNASSQRQLAGRLLSETPARADVFWVRDPFTAQRLRQKGAAGVYRSPAASAIAEAYRDPDGYWTGIAARTRVLLVNSHAKAAPVSVHAYTDASFRDRAAIAAWHTPATALQAAVWRTLWGDERFGAFSRAMDANGVTYTDGEEASADFVANGTFDFALVDSDAALKRFRSGAPVSIVYPDQTADAAGTLLVPDAAGIVHGARHPAEAKRLIDYLLSPEAMRRLAFSECALTPLRPDVETPSDIKKLGMFRAVPLDVSAVTRQRASTP